MLRTGGASLGTGECTLFGTRTAQCLHTLLASTATITPPEPKTGVPQPFLHGFLWFFLRPVATAPPSLI